MEILTQHASITRNLLAGIRDYDVPRGTGREYEVSSVTLTLQSCANSAFRDLSTGPVVPSLIVSFALGIPGSETAGNPGRCFGAMVGSHFSSYHWIQWIGPVCASISHGLLYYFVPPYEQK
ncbi:hypothetical protein MY10362_007935 [Beauveria mimosiformis]